VESAPRAYRLKAGNAASPISTFSGAIPQAAVDRLGFALASLPLIEADVAAGRLVCPIAVPQWHAGNYELVTNEERIGTPVVRAFRDWMRTMVWTERNKRQ
jgi:DNA-binding transcriptional LysR family regulator